MPLSWNEIKHRAIKFADEWQGAVSETAERQTFWNEFFEVFGRSRKAVAAYEDPVKKLSGHYGFIDLIWPGTLIVEHKSAGENLDKARSQAFAYVRALADSQRDSEMPRYIIVSDFARLALHDLESNVPPIEFHLADLHKNLRYFAFIAGYQQHQLDPEDPANEAATELMCQLHDALLSGGYEGHELRRFLVRILFCLFGEDTGIFSPDSFELFIKNRTKEDGSDLGPAIAHLFQVLNTPIEKRQKNLDEDLAQFPYVNGDLFAEALGFADFNSDMRNRLIACTAFRWERISPAVFGSLFQSVMDDKSRRQIGAHYTAEKNILKLIRSLFLDDLREEFTNLKCLKVGKNQRLQAFQDKLATLTFLDPACGCGNFLVLTYRELRKLELEVLLELHPNKQQELSLDEVNHLSKLNVHQFYGIEIEEFPARIAEVALWLTDHQANIELSAAFSQMVNRLPLRSSPHIHVANALGKDWEEILSPSACSYILGNPPFVGAKLQTAEQRQALVATAGDCVNAGLLDYVTGWYFKAAAYIRKNPAVNVAYVSTNSITQGEQVGVLWGWLLSHYQVKINFAHHTFAWESESRGKAHVHVVIIGFGLADSDHKKIYDYATDSDSPTISPATNISPYLTNSASIIITNRNEPICNVPEISIGNKPIDDGNYLFTPKEKAEFLEKEPDAAPYFHRWIGADEFINGVERWCLWLGDCSAADLRAMPECRKRVEAVRKFRLASKSTPTIKLAQNPTRFHVENFPQKTYLLIPRISSEIRNYIPMSFVRADVFASDATLLIPDATLYHFGVLTSTMHMTWVKQVCGRLESRYRYSAGVVYNNFPWPQQPTDKQRQTIEIAAQRILDLRIQCGDGRLGFLPTKATGIKRNTLADLYDPLAMPHLLVTAHQQLDRAVDLAYRKEKFQTHQQRLEHLFLLYEQLTTPLIVTAKPRRTTARKRTALI